MCKVQKGVTYDERLPDTRDGRVRGLRWEYVRGENYADDGLLTVMVQGEESRQYHVSERVGLGSEDARVFLLQKRGCRLAYEVHVSHRGESLDRCDCPHSHYHGVGCVHAAAMRAVLACGWCPDPFDSPLFGDLPTTEEIEILAVQSGLDSDPFRGQ